MSLSAQTERLDTLDQLECGEGVQSGSVISQDLDADSDGECDGAESLPELHAVVSWRGLNHLWEPLAVLAPVKFARIDNHAPNGGSVTANPLGGGVYYDIGTVVDGPDEVTASSEGVVDYHRHTVLMSDLCDRFKVWNIVLWVSNTLKVNRLGVLVNRLREVFWVVTVHKLRGYAKTRKGDLQLVVGTSVQVRRSDDVVSGMRKSRDDHELRSLTGCCSHSSNTALERCDSLFEHIHSRLAQWSAIVSLPEQVRSAPWTFTHVHYSAVNVAKLLEPE